MFREIVRRPLSGWPVLAVLVPLELALLAQVVLGAASRSPALVVAGILGFLLVAFLLAFIAADPDLPALLAAARERMSGDPGHDIHHALRVALEAVRMSAAEKRFSERKKPKASR